MKNLITRAVVLNVMILSCLPAVAAETGGHYVLPSGTEFSEFSVNLSIDCQKSPEAAGQFFAKTNNPAGIDKLNIVSGLLTESRMDGAQKVQVTSGNGIQLRPSLSSPWISVGTFSDSDVKNYCNAYQAWLATPPPRSPDMPMSVLPVTLNPGVRIDVSRSAEWSMCLTGFETTLPGRTIDYVIQISDVNGNSGTFQVQDEVVFSNPSDCQNWVEAPWVSQ